MNDYDCPGTQWMGIVQPANLTTSTTTTAIIRTFRSSTAPRRVPRGTITPLTSRTPTTTKTVRIPTRRRCHQALPRPTFASPSTSHPQPVSP